MATENSDPQAWVWEELLGDDDQDTIDIADLRKGVSDAPVKRMGMTFVDGVLDLGDRGKYAETDGLYPGEFAKRAAGKPSGPSTTVPPSASPNLGSERPTPIRPKDVGEAVDLILKGEVVEFDDIGQVHTALQKLAAIGDDAVKRGDKAPDYDLCKVNVSGTNLFCNQRVKTEEYPDGVPRIEMPQLGGYPREGSKAAALPRTAKGEVDAGAAFRESLKEAGIGTREERVHAGKLRATQNQLVGPTVAKMVIDSNRDPSDPKYYDPGKEPIFVSRDDYVLDGHHRWAAVVTNENDEMNIVRIDAPISEILHRANRFANDFGILPKAAPKLRAFLEAINLSHDGGHTGILICVQMDDVSSRMLAVPGGEPASDLHVTLCYCPVDDGVTNDLMMSVISEMSALAQTQSPLDGRVGGHGRFLASPQSDGKDVVYAVIDVPGLSELRETIKETLDSIGCPPSTAHDYTPHCTLGYIEPGSASPVQAVPALPLTVSDIAVWCNGRKFMIPFGAAR